MGGHENYRPPPGPGVWSMVDGYEVGEGVLMVCKYQSAEDAIRDCINDCVSECLSELPSELNNE